jgi:non-homologous end joining protein Ku
MGQEAEVKTTWSGTLSLSALVAPQVTIGSAVEGYEGGVSLKQVCECHNKPFKREEKCVGGKLRRTQARVKAGRLKGTTPMVMAFEEEDGTFTPVPAEILDEVKDTLDDEGGGEILPVGCVPYGEAPMEYATNLHYVRAADSKGAKHALGVIHRYLVEEEGRVLMAKWPSRGCEHLVAIHPVGEVLVMNEILYAQEVRDPDDDERCSWHYPSVESAPAKEVKLVGQLLDALGEFDLAEEEDLSVVLKAQKVAELRAGKKPAKRKAKAEPVEPEPTDLAALLEASVAAATGAQAAPAKRSRKTKARA